MLGQSLITPATLAAEVRAIPFLRPAFLTQTVQSLNPLGHPNWDRLFGALPGGSFFHGAAWVQVLQETYGYRPYYLTSKDAEGNRTLLPLMEVDSWLTGRRGISLPFTDDCEPICGDHESFEQLFYAAIRLGMARGWKTLEFRGGAKLFDAATPSLAYYTHNLRLASSEEAQFGRLKSSVRRAIRKAEALGVTVKISQTQEALADFYHLHCQTRKKHGMPPQPLSFFRNLGRHVLARNSGIVVVASHRGTPIAASVYFHHRDQAIYKYGASDERCQILRGSNLVMWSAIKWCLGQGMRELSLGRTSLANEGLRNFKLGWDAEEGQISYFKYDLRAGQFVSGKDATSGWHNRIFKNLPTTASRLIGQALYRHWA
jgi:hypothetical protein